MAIDLNPDGNHKSDDNAPDKCLATVVTFASDRCLGSDLDELSQWETIKDHLSVTDAQATEEPSSWRVFILNGIHRKLAAVLAQSLDIDPSFFDAHIQRSRYCLPSSAQDITCFQLDLPELRHLSAKSNYLFHPIQPGEMIQLNLNPPTLRTQFLQHQPLERAFTLCTHSERSSGSRCRQYVYFQRVSCWHDDKRRISVIIKDHSMAHLLPPDLSVIQPKNTPFAEIIERYGEGCASDVQSWKDSWSKRRQPDSPLDKLSFSKGYSNNEVYSEISHIAFDAWQALFAQLRIDYGPVVTESLLDVMMQRLENNLLDSQMVGPSDSRKGQWQSYINQLSTRQERHLRNTVTDLHRKLDRFRQREEIVVNIPRNDDDIEERRSLNRIAYMGGLLLPFSIVAGVFSMAPDFAPGGHLFFTYWVLTVPIVLIILVIIYADGIRKRYIVTGAATSDTTERQKRRSSRRRYSVPASRDDGSGTGATGSIAHESHHTDPIGHGSHRTGSVNSDQHPVIIDPASSENQCSPVELGNEEIEQALAHARVTHRFGFLRLPKRLWRKVRPEPGTNHAFYPEPALIPVPGRRTEELGWGRAVLTLFGFKPKWASESGNIGWSGRSTVSG